MKQIFKIPAVIANSMRRGFSISSAFVVVFLALALNSGAGVLVAPTIIFLSDKSRTGRMTVQNPTNQPKEITIKFSFCLPKSDSLGNVSVRLIDSGVTDPHAAMDWIRAFPRKLTLPANGSQVIRFRGAPPADLPDGEYWARVVVRSEEGQTILPNPTDNEAITTKLNMIMQTAIMLKYRKGEMTSQLDLNDVSVKIDSSMVTVLADMTNTGNCSYVGILNCRLLDARKREVSARRVQLAVYYSLKRKIELPIPADGDFEAPYTVDLFISTSGRTDIPSKDVVPGNEIQRSFAVR